MNNTQALRPTAWLCELMQEDGTTRQQFVTEDPAGLRWNDAGEPSPFRVTPLYSALAQPQPSAPSVEPAPTRADLIAALTFYADGLHFDRAAPGEWDTVSDEPQNWWCDAEGTATVEDGYIAKATLSGQLTADQINEMEDGESLYSDGIGADPLMANGLTEAETAATASVAGLSDHLRLADMAAEQAAFCEWASAPLRADKLPLDTWDGPGQNGGFKDERTYSVFYGWLSHARHGTAPQAAPVSAPTQGEVTAALLAVGTEMVNITTTVRGIEEWPAIPTLWLECMKERDALLAARASAPAVAAPEPAQPDGRLHTDGYFTWARRDGYVMDKRLPCGFYLAAPTVKDSLTVAAQPSAAPLLAREPRQPLTDEQLDAAPAFAMSEAMRRFGRRVESTCAAAWGITLAAAPAAQSSTKEPGHE